MSDAQPSPKWDDVVTFIPSPHNRHFQGSTARIGAEGQLIVMLPPMANIEAVERQLGDVVHRAVTPVYGEGIRIQYEQPKLAKSANDDDPPSTPQTAVKTKGFTPLVDALSQELGLIPAAIYGVIWRYCQMNSRTCYASQQAIADRLGVSRKTITRNLKPLEDDGYIRCLNPDAPQKGETKIYIVTNKVEIEAGFSMKATIH